MNPYFIALAIFALFLAWYFPPTKKPLTTMWGDDTVKPNIAGVTVTHACFILFIKPDGTKLEAGMRSDGVVVWREVKP